MGVRHPSTANAEPVRIEYCFFGNLNSNKLLWAISHIVKLIIGNLCGIFGLAAGGYFMNPAITIGLTKSVASKSSAAGGLSWNFAECPITSARSFKPPSHAYTSSTRHTELPTRQILTLLAPNNRNAFSELAEADASGFIASQNRLHDFR